MSAFIIAILFWAMVCQPGWPGVEFVKAIARSGRYMVAHRTTGHCVCVAILFSLSCQFTTTSLTTVLAMVSVAMHGGLRCITKARLKQSLSMSATNMLLNTMRTLAVIAIAYVGWKCNEWVDLLRKIVLETLRDSRDQCFQHLEQAVTSFGDNCSAVVQFCMLCITESCKVAQSVHTTISQKVIDFLGEVYSLLPELNTVLYWTIFLAVAIVVVKFRTLLFDFLARCVGWLRGALPVLRVGGYNTLVRVYETLRVCIAHTCNFFNIVGRLLATLLGSVCKCASCIGKLLWRYTRTLFGWVGRVLAMLWKYLYNATTSILTTVWSVFLAVVDSCQLFFHRLTVQNLWAVFWNFSRVEVEYKT